MNNLDHAEQLRKLIEVIRQNQSFINKNTPKLEIEREEPLRPEKLRDGGEFL